MFGTPASSPASSPERLPRVDTPVHRTSRRLLGLSPEFGPLPERMTAPVSSVPDMTSPSTTQVTVLNPQIPVDFHGNTYEDADDWLEEFERVANVNGWNAGQKLGYVYFPLQDGARTWFTNRVWSSWDEFRRKFLDTFASTERREHAQRLLESRIQKPNESVAMFVEDMARLFHRADPDMSEAKKISHLMRGVKEQLFAGLVRSPPTSVDEFSKEAIAIERALHLRYRQYDRLNNSGPVSATAVTAVTTPDERSLRQLIREIVQEEVKKLVATPNDCAIASVTEVVRQEIRQALSLPEPNSDTVKPSYADIVRRQPSNGPPPQQYHQPQPPTAPWYYRETSTPMRPPLRKTDIWRTPDYRPLCFHCGEAGHIVRYCPYRVAGYQGFPSTTPRRHFNGRPHIDTSMTTSRDDSPGFRSRSPSPGRYSPSNRRTPTDMARGRSPSPRRGN